LPHRFGTISFSVAAPRADVHMCVVPRPRPEAEKKKETFRPFAVLPWADEDEAAGIRNHTSEERVVVFFSTVQNLHGIAPTRSPNPSSARALGIGTVHGQSTDPF